MAKLATLVDSFTTNTGLWTMQNGANIAGGTLNVPCAVGYGSAVTDLSWDLTSSSVSVQLLSVAANLTTSEHTFRVANLYTTGFNDVGFFLDSSGLRMIRRIAGTASATSITYNATDHKWLRLRDDGTNFLWDTSPDGLNWTNRRSLARGGLVLNACQIELNAGSFSGSAQGSTVFDNINNPPVSAAGFQGWGIPNWQTASGGGGGAITNLPPQPGAVVYGNPGTNGAMSAYAHPGGMVLASRDNYDDAVMHTISAAGGHVLIYLDAIVWNTYGRYHDLLFNSSAYGAAVPKWPGPVSANSTGDLADFRVGGVLQGKLEAIMELMVSENPHMAGFFMDDVGSRSWFPNFEWSTFGSTNQADYRAGAIAICQTARTVCDRHGLIFMVNGTWTQGSLASSGGGYPTTTTHGNALAEGGCVEHHDGESAFFGPYMDAATSQWGESSSVTSGAPFCFVICSDATGVTEYRANNKAAWISEQPSAEYDGVLPWGTISDFHPTGLPNQAS